VGCGRKQQEVRGGFCQRLAQAIPSDLLGTAAKTVSFVADNEIPPGIDEIPEPFLIVCFQFVFGHPRRFSTGLIESTEHTT